MRVALFGADSAAVADLASGLHAAGVTVSVVTAPAAALQSADTVAEALHDVAAGLGGLDGVVDAAVAWAPHEPGPLCDLSESGWHDLGEAPLKRGLHLLQGACRVLRDEGGSIVVVLPTMVLTGAPQAVGWVTAAEGYRGLAKAAARSWGRDGIRVNCVCAPTRSFGVPAADRDGLQPPALADEVGLRNGLAPAVAGLLSNGFGPVTGQTIAVDGGVWMTP